MSVYCQKIRNKGPSSYICIIGLLKSPHEMYFKKHHFQSCKLHIKNSKIGQLFSKYRSKINKMKIPNKTNELLKMDCHSYNAPIDSFSPQNKHLTNQIGSEVFVEMTKGTETI